METKRHITKPYLRSLKPGDIVAFTGLYDDEVNSLRVLCSQMKAEGYQFEVRTNTDSGAVIVRRKSSDKL